MYVYIYIYIYICYMYIYIYRERDTHIYTHIDVLNHFRASCSALLCKRERACPGASGSPPRGEKNVWGSMNSGFGNRGFRLT